MSYIFSKPHRTLMKKQLFINISFEARVGVRKMKVWEEYYIIYIFAINLSYFISVCCDKN